MTRVAIYARVSTEDQAREGFSLDAQLESLRAYCKARTWEIVKEYVDDGHSGRNIKRPAYQTMMAEKDIWDMILVVKMDRIHRNSRNFMEMMDNINSWDKGFTSMQESLDTSTAMGRFVVDIIQRIAQLESEQIGERVYAGMRQKASTVGGILGFNAPFGYEFEDGNLIIKDAEAEVVRDIFVQYLSGKTMKDIAEMLNSQAILTKKNKQWTKWSISHILHNPIYAGHIYWDGILKESAHKRIIDIGVFDSAQRLINSRTRRRASDNMLLELLKQTP